MKNLVSLEENRAVEAEPMRRRCEYALTPVDEMETACVFVRVLRLKLITHYTSLYRNTSKLETARDLKRDCVFVRIFVIPTHDSPCSAGTLSCFEILLHILLCASLPSFAANSFAVCYVFPHFLIGLR